MEKLLFSAVWLLLYWYYTEQIGTIQKGKGRRAAAFGLAAGMLALSVWLPVSVTWIMISILLFLYDLFFDGEQIRTQWWRILLPGIVFSLVLCFPARLLYAVNGPVLFLLFLLLAQKRDFLRPGSAFLTAAIYGILSFLLWSAASDEAGRMADPGTRQLLLWSGILLEILLFLALEGTLYSYKTGFEHQAERFQKDVMGHQYEEIKSIYMNMRGWRHDYHNHLQVMKAQLDLGNTKEARQYLDELERDLDRVDTYIKSGNLMVDAILNSKLSLAQQRKIEKPGNHSRTDLCVCTAVSGDFPADGLQRLRKTEALISVPSECGGGVSGKVPGGGCRVFGKRSRAGENEGGGSQLFLG